MKRGGAAIVHPGPASFITCKRGVRGDCAHPPPTYMQPMRAGLSFSYPPISLLLRQPLSIKKSYAGAIQSVTFINKLFRLSINIVLTIHIDINYKISPNDAITIFQV